MKKSYLSIVILLFSTILYAQEALITGYVDATCSGANGRVLEIYADGTVDFTDWNVQRQANGNGYSTNIDLSSLGTITDGFAYITNDEAIFTAEFGISTNIIESSVISSNGNDAFQVTDDTDAVIDRFGEENADGSGTDWEHEDSYYLRNDGASANSGSFDVTNWTFGASAALAGEGLCNGESAYSTIVDLGDFSPSTTTPSEPLGLGQMAFTAFNADGDDDFAMVTFTDIPANTSIYFSDKEWTGTELNSGEASYEWQTGNTVIPAGSVISFNTISETPSVTYGNIVGSPGGLSSGSEAIFAYLGSDIDTPTEFIAAIANSASGFGTLENTGLIDGLTAITLPEGTDIADYTGPRTGLDRVGYLLALSDISNFAMQDTDNDDHNDGTAPDLPLDETMFNLSSTDVTAPQVVYVSSENQTETKVVFSEEITSTTAEDVANYSFSPSITISSISYDNATSTATLTHDDFSEGTAYTLTVEETIEDLSGTAMDSDYNSDDLFYNSLEEGLLITEIMYNAPSDASDALEFIEVYNHSENTIALGGIRIKDEDNFVFTFPETELDEGEIVLLATDKATADSFYGATFIDLPQEISNAIGNGGEQLDILNTEGTTIFSVEYDDGGDWPANADGDGPSIELQNPNGDANNGLNWAAATNLVGQSEGDDVFASPGTFNPITDTTPVLTFDEAYLSVMENDGTLNISLSISENPEEEVSIDVAALIAESTATEDEEYSFSNQTLTFSPDGALTQEISLTLLDNDNPNPDSLLALELSNPENAELGNSNLIVIYILDDETHTAEAPNTLGIAFSNSYAIEGDNPGSEILTYDANTERLFVMNSGNTSVEVLDFSNPTAISDINTIDLSSYGTGGTSVATHNGIVAAAVVGNATDDNGTVVFMDTDGTVLASVEAGALPDMVTFTPDGNHVLVANEGEPNSDYSIDPEGSVSIIDISSGVENITQANVTQLNFNAFDNQIDDLKDSGIRIFGPGASVSQDLEPEYISVSEDSQKAWVSLQENNAVAVIDLSIPEITDIFPLGTKDHSLPGNTLDTSNETDFIFMANWSIKGMYMPDAIANYTVNGTTYFVTANEGDAREYDVLEEEVNIDDVVLDASVFPNQDFLQREENLGKVNMTSASGDIDNDGEYEEIHVFGGRSFSIFNGEIGDIVYDSGDDFERIIAEDPVYYEIFNTTDDENKFKNRSDNKGPEPEAVIVQEIEGEFYAFIGLERVGGFMTYNITDPQNPVFEGYFNNRSTEPGEDIEGDLAPESIVYISPSENSEEKGLIVIANEVSATVSVYTLENNTLSVEKIDKPKNNFSVYPNPAIGDYAFFNQPTDYVLYDLQGRKITEKHQATHIDVSTLNTGTYLVKNKKGQVQKLIVN